MRFQPLARELEPVARYLAGTVLNAGCGERDLSALLRAYGATRVESCDAVAKLPNQTVCDLSVMPYGDETYDAILCNAVLEHVEHPDRVMAELRRVLRGGGCLVLSVPFLQPFHAVPTDFRRYTRDGLLAFGSAHGFDVVEIRPVHSMAQSVAWILWACLREKRRFVTMAALWLPLWLWTWFSQRTDWALVENANTYQLVLRKVSPAS